MTHIVHRNLREAPPVAVSGHGIWLRDASGHEVIDGSGGAAVACLGHGHPHVIQAMKDQIDRLCYAHTALFSAGSAEQLADMLVGHAPGGLTHAYFVSSGSEGMEAALKIARQWALESGQPQRTKFIARRQSYHGNTLGALAAGGNAMRRAPYAPILSDAFSHVSPCFAYRDRRDGETDADYVARLAAELEAEFQRLGPSNVIAFCAETVVGATLGCATALPGYFPAMKAVCERHGALLILDEVMSGMGRTGTLHAWEQEGVSPDIQVIAKGLGGGYQPIGGILVHGRVIEALARPHLPGASGRLRGRAGGAGSHPRRKPARQRAGHGRAAGTGPARPPRQPREGRRHPRPRPVLGGGTGHRPRRQIHLRPRTRGE